MARGKLRIYLGAAPGVGKTFAMLNEGRRRCERGEDVVCGFVETHARRRTGEQIGELEVVPRKRLPYRDRVFEEMDIDAILARRPEIALVDELAHTNIPGSRNEKRWQDVEELLDAGISVISTLNIQHLESLNDVIAQITGVTQQETIPDAVVRQAEQMQLVDLAPETVRARLARGDIYPTDRVDTALSNFFRAGNLGALRELALLWIADQVEEGIKEYRERHGVSEPWETRERVIVALSGSERGERLVRRAARVAQRRGSELVGVHVRPQDGLAGPTRERLQAQRELLTSLGGGYREVVGAEVGPALVEAARSLNANQIVLGATRRSRLGELLHGSVISTVIHLTGASIDVHVISYEEEDEEVEPAPPRRRRPGALPSRRIALGFALAAAGLPLLTVTLASLRSHVALPSVLLLYLLLVVFVSAIGGLWPALATALAGDLLANWYFTPPIHTFTISEPQNLFALCVFLVVAVVFSSYVALAARRATAGEQARTEADIFLTLSGHTPVGALLDRLQRALQLDGVALLTNREGSWGALASSGEQPARNPENATQTIDLGQGRLLAISGRTVAAEEERILEAFVRELSSSLAHEALETEAQTVGALAAGNELRAAILSAVSHDLRTPLSAIKASVSSLLQQDVKWTKEARREFLRTIDEEADRLNALVGNLLDMSRLQAGALTVSAEPIGLEEIVPAALHSLGERASRVRTEVPETLPRVLADAGLLERALANLLDNALRHCPEDTEVRVVADPTGDEYVDLRIVDHGPGVPESERERIFVPFQRLGDVSGANGVGLGLAVARGFIEAMEGSIEGKETSGGGLTMIVRLRAER
jgi:two-component system, OmpR family, sensor histidine kinase KdpD